MKKKVEEESIAENENTQVKYNEHKLVLKYCSPKCISDFTRVEEGIAVAVRERKSEKYFGMEVKCCGDRRCYKQERR